ncbi:MAG: NADH-quinone oxidoreductase subunit L [Candidatus Methylacidiphilales bacterium]|nr:NADH-quinone oxidoreductase subunit L [Candidatus Methylacidiphilales bacterium]
MTNAIPWFLLIAPLLSAVTIFSSLLRAAKPAALLSIAACAVSFGIAVAIKMGALLPPVPMTWIEIPGLLVQIGWQNDELSQLMLLVVTGVGLLVHIYSFAYMEGDKGYARFFGELSLFMFSMLGIVIANNFIQMFIFWELVGLSSYLLIGFWFEKDSAAAAAKKAFLVNRIGDFGFLLGIITFWTLTGTVAFNPEAWSLPGNDSQAVVSLVTILDQKPELTTLIYLMGLGLFCGCMGKSAMVPLHVWLPDAMEGPTPVSALIHAATMVAAGVYMICRVYPILALSGILDFIANIGMLTLLIAAVVAVQQTDIKRILAYSTLSQLGYMVMAVGFQAPGAAMFHLTTHACFKALLFLGAGSVIHAMHHEQNIFKMGGLRKKIPLTHWTFVIGTLALTGCPGLAGFFSKDEILVTASHPLHFAVALLTAGLTSFYMFRLYFVTFWGEPHSEEASHAHESPAAMFVPLILLAIPSVLLGFPQLGLGHAFFHFFHETFPNSITFPDAHEHGLNIIVAGSSVIMFAIGLVGAYMLYGNSPKKDTLPNVALVQNKFYFDAFYDNVVLTLQQLMARMLATVDYWILGTFMVRGTATIGSLGGELLRLFQTGNMQTYAFLFSLGAALIFYYTLFS